MSSVFTQKATRGGNSGGAVPSEGTHPAILVAIIDLGTHQVEYKEGRKKARKVMLVWELTAEKDPGFKDKNFFVTRDFVLTFGPKSGLRQMAEKWRGKAFADDEEFDVSKLLGKPCLLSLVHKQAVSSGNVYAKIEAVASVVKGMTIPPAQVKPILWELASGQPIPQEVWIPFLYGKSVKDVIQASEEWKARGPGGATGEPAQHDEPDDSDPF